MPHRVVPEMTFKVHLVIGNAILRKSRL